MPIDFSKMSDEELLALYKQDEEARKGSASNGGFDVNSLLNQAQGKPTIGQRVGGAVKGMASAGMQMYGGVKPDDSQNNQNNMVNDLLKLALGEKIKKQIEGPEYVTSYDPNTGQPVFTPSPGKIKNAPFYASSLGQGYYGARTNQAEAQGRQAQAESQIMEETLPKVQEAMRGGTSQGIIPGTKLQAGPLSIPLNPELTENEAMTFGTVPVLNDAVQKFTQLIQQGATSSGNTMQNAYSGFAVDKGFAPLTYGNETLSQAQAELNRIKANTLFSEGGKNLTVNERQVIENLFSTSGKSTERIINDVQEGVRKYNEFVEAKRGGMFGYQPSEGQPQSQSTQQGFQDTNKEARYQAWKESQGL